jgi:uncharacterized membrane protein YagU involved in acid resistance
MTIAEASAPPRPAPQAGAIELSGILLAIAVGTTGGALAASIGQSSTGRLSAVGAVFGLVFAVALQRRATSAGAGLVWGLGAGYLLWIVLSGLAVVFPAPGYSTDSMLGEARARFPELVGCITCIGAPVGFCLGLRATLRSLGSGSFHWGRAIVAGGTAGVGAALIFSRWMYVGDFYPLISGFGRVNTQFHSVVFHFAVACLIGSTFGLLFQKDVRNFGSAMGWGVAYAMAWWFLAQLTLFPLAAGTPLDWSAGHASELFGSMVGHILFGLILGFVYSGADAVWTRLFIDADPLNRKRQGPGVRLLLSLSWGAGAGLAGGLVALPLMIHTGVIAKLAGLDSGLPLVIGIGLHLTVSTLVGASYGVLFRGETENGVFGSLWGLLFGLMSWYAGPLTLLPLLRTGECDWRPEAAAALLPSLVGHVLFGLVTANVFWMFERRYTRWLLGDPRYAGLERRSSRPVATPAPALGAFVIGIGVLLPILLS